MFSRVSLEDTYFWPTVLQREFVNHSAVCSYLIDNEYCLCVGVAAGMNK